MGPTPVMGPIPMGFYHIWGWRLRGISLAGIFLCLDFTGNASLAMGWESWDDWQHRRPTAQTCVAGQRALGRRGRRVSPALGGSAEQTCFADQERRGRPMPVTFPMPDPTRYGPARTDACASMDGMLWGVG
ncbi:hypothetical protein B0H12DRAFT_1103708 [Mycena haematopus]|nr:hypothetical protein B0H12DRAFT_1103708 [Mycena haematopus]